MVKMFATCPGAVSEQIRGESGSSVVLTLRRRGTPTPLEYALQRRAIRLDAVVDVGMRTDAIGYIKLRQFTDDADEAMRVALRDLDAAGMQALIIDLRENPVGPARGTYRRAVS